METQTLPPGFEELDFDAFHKEELPRRLARGNGALAAEELAEAGTLAFRLPGGEAYTYVPRADGIDVLPGDAEASTVVELGHAEWQGLVHDLESAPGLLYGGRVKSARGNLMRFVRWEPGLRAMFQGRPVFHPDRCDLRDRHGAPLDPHRRFHIDDDREDMAHFLRTAGFLLVKGVFGADEIARFREAAEILRQEAREGDKQSWWGRNQGGESVLCRVLRGGTRPVLRELGADPRLASLSALADEPLAARGVGTDEAVTVLYKNRDMSEGLSDIPWHRDCGMGGHAVMCPLLISTVCLTRGSAEAGELRVLPGSWQSSYGFIDANDPQAPRGVSLDVEAGDVSLHYGDVMHASPPPTGAPPHRISLLLAFVREDARPHGGKRHYNDVLLSRDDGQVEHLEDVVKRR